MPHQQTLPFAALRNTVAMLFLLCAFSQAAIAATAKQSFTQELDALGVAFSEYMNQQDLVAALNLFDSLHLAQSITEGLDLNEQDAKTMQGHMLTSLNSTEWLKNFLIQNSPTFVPKTPRKLDGKQRAVIRVDNEDGGHNFLELICKRNNKNVLKIVDIYVATTGQTIKDSIIDATSLMLPQTSGLIGKLLAAYQGEEPIHDRMLEIVSLRKQGKLKEAYMLTTKLPKTVRDSEVIMSLSVVLASAVDDNTYQAELHKLAELHGDNAKFSFMLIDHYFMEEDYKRALNATNTLLKRYGNDAALLTIQGGLLHLVGKPKKGNAAFETAISEEPNSLIAYWSLMEYQASSKQFDAAVNTIGRMEAQFDYTFTLEDFDTASPSIALLVASNPFKKKFKPQ